MITDQNNMGIPSASRGRMQLVKPQQTLNSGSTNPTSERYNPIMAKADSQTPNPLKAPSVSPKPSITNPVKPETDAQGYNPTYGYATGVKDPDTGEELFSNPQYLGKGTVATPSYQDMVSELGKRFSNMTEDDQIRFLKNVANGIYKANGMATSATMTGDKYIANSYQDKYK